MLRLFLSLLLFLACAVPASLHAQAFGPPIPTTGGASWPGYGAGGFSSGAYSEEIVGSVHENGSFIDFYGWFQWGTNTSYGNITTPIHFPAGPEYDGYITTNLTGLAPNTTYHYQAVGSNYLGVAYGYDASFVSAGPPVITNQPQSRVVAPGAFVSFSVGAYSSLGVWYQWTKNGVNINNATNATYSIASAQSSDAATYQATVSNYFEGLWVIYSSPATLKVGGYPPPMLQSSVSNGNFVFSWPVYVPPYTLQSATSLAPSNWSNAPVTLTTNSDNIVTTTAPITDAAAFYRLQHP